MAEARSHVYSGRGIDRAAERRRDEAWLRERRSSPDSRVVPLRELQVLVTRGDEPRAVALPLASWPAGGELLFLGEADGATWFAAELPGGATAEALEEVGEWVELRAVGARLPPLDAALLAHARGLLYWHRRHRHCGDCGAPTRMEEAGHLRRCTAPGCGATHFPRTDPAIIVLVRSGERALLGRQPQWAPGQYSTLAGFVEPGESLEDAVAREVREETGVEVRDVRYHSSQPWPFPASLMVGFTAAAASEEIRVDHHELEDARWFSREEIRRGVAAGELRLSSPVSISYALIRDWLEG
jgi:NAD+ diphosphatase